MTVHRLLCRSDGKSKDQVSVDEHLHALNTKEETIAAATNI